MSAPARLALRVLARELGVASRWRAHDGKTRAVSDDALLAVVTALLPEVTAPEHAAGARRALHARACEDLVDPVVVAWDASPPTVTLHLPAGGAARDVASAGEVRVVIEHEDGRVTEPVPVGGAVRVAPPDGRHPTTVGEVRLPEPVPFGFHRVHVSAGHRQGSATLVSAPSRIPAPGRGRHWGVFAPVHSLHDRDRATTGDLRALGRLASFAAAHGADVIGTLPLLAAFVGHRDEPCDPSPYAPVSRRFWNETFLDLRAIPELDGKPVPPDPSPGLLVDLPALAAARRPVLARAAAAVERDATRRRHLRAFLEAHPDARAYARHRAGTEGTGPAGARYHEYVQWIAHEQLGRLARELKAQGQMLYLDLPVGTHPNGFDVSCRPDLFVRGASVGAPPDAFQPHGQDWGFPPTHPVHARRAGYTDLRAALDAHLRHARLLRIDHVMGLHRLWFVPEGASPRDGAYVRYRPEEQWAVVCAAAARHGAGVVGENLGTVAPETNRALGRHHALAMWVAQFEAAHEPLPPPPARTLACLDTHDLPTFASWWHDLAPGPRRNVLEALRDAGCPAAGYGEVLDPLDVLEALLAWLGASRARVVMVSLEDLWLEVEAQNRPGVAHHQNFRRRAAHGVEELEHIPAAARLLGRLDAARRRRQEPRGRDRAAW